MAGIEAPYLQLVLIRMWDEERETRVDNLRLETLERLGGADRIVRTHLDASLGALPVAAQDLAGRTLRFLVTPSGTKIALRITDLSDYASVSPEQLEPLVDASPAPRASSGPLATAATRSTTTPSPGRSSTGSSAGTRATDGAASDADS